MSKTKRYLGWSRCPRHPDAGRTIAVTDDREIEDGCGICEDDGLAEYNSDELAYVLNDAKTWSNLGRDTQ